MAKGQIKQKLTEETVRKLEEAFAIDASVEEACYYADISRQCYYTWTKEFPELYDRFTRLRNRPVLLARQTVVKRIPESYANAIDFLKRKKKLEFGDNIDFTTGGDKFENNAKYLTEEQLRNISKGGGQGNSGQGII